MAELDFSSYPKAQMPVSALEKAGNIANVHRNVIGVEAAEKGLESQQLGIDKQKLDLVNQRFGEMAKGFTALINDPEVNPDKVSQYVTNQVKLGYIPAEMAAQTLSQLPPTQGMPPQQASQVIRKHLEQQLQHAQSTVEAINYHAGQPGTMSVGNAVQPVRTSPQPGFGIRSEGLPIAMQQPPDTQEVDQATGERRYRGVQPPVSAPGMVTAPPPMGNQPTAAPVPTPSPRPRSAMPVEPVRETFDQRFDAAQSPRGGLAAPSPMFETGLKQKVEDQNIATSKMQAAKPAIQALKLMPGLSTGPGTAQFTDLMAGLKAWGLADIKENDDPTVLRQKIEKKLAGYIANSGIASRSDAAQVLAEAASPNPKKQLLPALMDLTRDAIVLDRVEAARPAAFEGKDLSKYGDYRSTFPQSIDERAFGLDMMEKDKARALLTRMKHKYEKNPKDPEVLKFAKSLEIAKKQGFFSPSDLE